MDTRAPSKQPLARSSAWVWTLAIVLIASLALGVRLIRLNRVSLDFDEYLHVAAAQSLISEGRPALPSAEDYRRAFGYTWLVAQSIRAFGSSEAAVRLPSVVFGMALVLLAGWWAKRWWGWGPALLTMLLIGVEPFAVQLSSVCRMYTAFHGFYLLGLWAWFEVFEGGHSRLRRAAWFCTAAAASLAAVHLHDLGAELAVGVAVFALLQALLTQKKTYVGLVLLGAAVFALAVQQDVVDISRIWQKMNAAPAYARSGRYDTLFYLREFWAVDPWLVIGLAPALMAWLVRNRARGLYLSCAVLVPLALHSFIMDWKQERYVLHILAPLLLVAATALWWLIEAIAARFSVQRFKVAAFFLLPLVVWCFRSQDRTGLDGEVANWRAVFSALRTEIKPEDALIITVPLASHYYLNRLPDYLTLNPLIKDSGKTAKMGQDGFLHDRYAGKPLITDAVEMERVFRQHPSGWIVGDVQRFPYDTCVPKAVRDLIALRCRRWPSPDPSVIIYVWGK